MCRRCGFLQDATFIDAASGLCLECDVHRRIDRYPSTRRSRSTVSDDDVLERSDDEAEFLELGHDLG